METTLSNFISPHRNHRETLLTTPRVRRNSDSVRLRRHSSSSMQSSTQSSPLRSARGPSTLSAQRDEGKEEEEGVQTYFCFQSCLFRQELEQPDIAERAQVVLCSGMRSVPIFSSK
mmetsp:Transcript_39889/g.125304  ORF Transcript_39889/g.125304 Transcript_39889/m.125304 type:complete len:116 (-) Transcript_39889:162-509(-)